MNKEQLNCLKLVTVRTHGHTQAGSSEKWGRGSWNLERVAARRNATNVSDKPREKQNKALLSQGCKAAGQGSPVMQPAARAHLDKEGTESIWRNTTRVSQLLTGLLAWTCFLTLSVTACPISFPGEARSSGKNLSTTFQKLKFESQFCFLVGDLKKITLEF